MQRVCICGGGSLGHVIGGFLASKGCEVNVLTSKPQCWGDSLIVDAVDGRVFEGRLHVVSDQPSEVIPEADVVLLCLPGYAIKPELERIRCFLAPNAVVGCVFSSTGFFFEALELLPPHVGLFGFQRVPFIARTQEYGRSARLLGYKSEHKIAVENVSDIRKEEVRLWWERMLEVPVMCLANYLEASLTNSNPLLHTSRLYTMFGDWQPGVTYPRNFLFYEEWTESAAALYIKMDEELFRLLDRLPVTPGFLLPALEYYESHDAASLCRKLSSIQGFKGIYSPMREETEGQWVPDFGSRYFTEDFGHSLKYIWQLAHQYGVDVPAIDSVYEWGRSKIE